MARELKRRELEVLNVLASLHREFGGGAAIAREAVEHVYGERCAGTLAMLAVDGYAVQRSDADGHVVYTLLPAGHEAARQAIGVSVHINGTRPS